MLIPNNEARKYMDVIRDVNPKKSGLEFKYKGYFRDPGHGYFYFIGSGEDLGGFGITARNLDQLEVTFPGFERRMDTETGKIVFLGNGLSDVPLIPAERYSCGEIEYPPVINDLFDYGHLYLDLLDLRTGFTLKGLRNPFENVICRLENLIEQVDLGNVVMKSYFFGSKDVPLEYCDASFAINSFGPPVTTISEQVSILGQGGELYYLLQTFNQEKFPLLGEEYTVTPRKSNNGFKWVSVVREG